MSGACKAVCAHEGKKVLFDRWNGDGERERRNWVCAFGRCNRRGGHALLIVRR